MQTNNPNNKRRFDPAQQQPYRYTAGQSQGPQTNAPQRNAVPTGNIRGQNGPTRQTQPPQLAQQTATQSTVAALQQQQQHQHSVAVQQQQMSYQYQTAPGPIMVQSTYGGTPNQAPMLSYRFAAYSNPQGQPFYITPQHFPGQYIQTPLHQTAHQTHPHHPAYTTAYQVPTATPQYMPTPRIPTQMQQSHVTQQHVQQHQVHHQGQHHVAQTATAVHHPPPHTHQHPPPAVSNPIPQPQGRNDGVQAPQTERKRKILNIINPTTGQNVLDDAPVPTDSTSSGQISGDSNKPVHTAPADSTSVAPSSATVSSNVALEKAIETSAQSQFPNSQQTFPTTGVKPVEEVSISAGSKNDELSPEEAIPESGEQNKSNVKAIRAEFFQKITQASDEGRVSSSSSNQNASQTQQTSQSADTSNTQSDTSKLNSTNPVADETTPEESKDTSLASISPTPIENYVTPKSARDATPPAVVPIDLPQDDLEESIVNVEDEEPSVEAEIVEAPQPAPVIPAEISAPVSDEALSPVSDTVEDPLIVQEEEIKKESFIPEKTPDLEEDLENDKSSTPVPAEEQQNGNAKLEEGEIGPDEEQSPSYESGADDADESETEFKSKKGGIIKYEREFLLKLEKQPLSRMKVAIEIPDVAKDANNAKGHHNQQMSNKSPGNIRDPYNNMRSRGPVKPMNLGNVNQLGMRGSPSPMHMQQWGPMVIPPAPPRGHPPKIIELSTVKVELHKADNAWKPSLIKQVRGGTSDPDKTEEEVITEDIVKRTRGILNKLTPENFDKLLGKFMQLQLNDMESRIQEVIKVVFEKAIDEPSFSATYAKLVYTVCKNSPETSKKFRKQILDQCQREFQKNTSDEDEIRQAEEKLAAATEDKKEQLKLDLEEMKYGMRRRSLGNVRFIGELYKLQMLTPKIMVECVNMLLNNPDEENLECLCKLLSTVGQKLDDNLRDQELKVQHCKQNKLELPKFNPDDKYMDKTFQKLRNLSDNKTLSSRIRFALLDVVELRENGWKPRRDTNAPKTIEEVRRDAIRQEMEEKRQINSLPPASSGGPGMDQRGQSGRQQSSMGGPGQQKKTGDWNTVQSNKSSRFQVKKQDQSGMPVLAPSGGAWGRGQGPPSSNTNSHSNNLPTPPKSIIPPRFNRFSGLSVDEPRSNNSSVSNNQSPSNFRDPVPQTMHSQFPPPLRRPSPATSTASSRENSRPVSPKEPSPSIPADKCTADVRETVKNIFEEYFSVKKFDDTLHWINSRFEGERIGVFVEELSRQVGDMSKEDQQKTAGHLVRLLLKNKVVSKNVVITALAQGVVQDLPDLIIDVPKSTTYLGQFLVEIFVDEDDLDWLVNVVDPLLKEDFYVSTGEELISNTLHLLKLRRNEEAVQVLFKKTVKKEALQQSVPWLAQLTGESIQSLSQKIIPVLKSRLNSPEEIRQSLQERSWDLREELTAESFIEAICTLAWTEKKEWDVVTLSKLLPLLPLPDKQLFPKVWAQAKRYFQRSSIDQGHEDELWTLMSKLNLVDNNE